MLIVSLKDCDRHRENSLLSIEAYDTHMRQWTGLALVQETACAIFSTGPVLLEPMLKHCLLILCILKDILFKPFECA